MDNLSTEARRKNMQNIRSKGTKIEEIISHALWNQGVRFRKHQKGLPGNPDISIKKYKIVIFLDSCFFHGCPLHFTVPKTNVDYWTSKINRNKERDKKVNSKYQEMDWKVLRFWEHEIKTNKDEIVALIIREINEKK